jgi:hypothetical protein
MITNPLLEEIEQIQKQLAQEAQYDLNQHVVNSHQIVLAVERQYGIKFQYSSPNQVSWTTSESC